MHSCAQVVQKLARAHIKHHKTAERKLHATSKKYKRSNLFEVINIIDLIKIVVKQYIVVVFVNVVLTASGKHQPRYIVLQICLVFCLAISISLVYSQCKQLKTKVESYACKAFERAC